ncbi:RNA polymerase sigma factor [Clostridium sp. OS1-26]|uniref:RNA polymerase sigma factor n=1 Tax=Clostridium sp. OS1-26 TaxID=3070681 RepID=UPI0027DED788|nr:RNA polymerase sigma factor [Clostridium sp. OS1-26]WML33268.1 RNA polymerase sigma factor [Clostridium sp. OS1-26]
MDKKLIKQIRKGNRSAANDLISRYYKEIYTYVYKQTIDKELSMDLTQDIFISMLKSIDNFDDKKASFRTWLYKITTYRIVDYYRSRYYKYTKISVPIEDTKIYDDKDIITAIEYKQDAEGIIAIVNTFDSICQQIVRLKLFGEYTFKEISTILQISESTVKTKYYSTINKIRSLCKE